MEKSINVLVVDDEQIIRDFFRRLLREEFTVVTAKDGYEAIRAAKRNRFDVIFMDVKMPGINGVETLRKIKEVNPEATVFMMTAFEVPGLIEKAIREGANGCLYKPFDVADVLQAVQKRKFVLEKLPVEKEEAKLLLDIEDIFYISSEGNYAYVHTADERFLIKATLAELERRLGEKSFFRVHRHYIVNLDKVKEVVPLSRPGILLVLADEKRSKIPVSRSRARETKELLGV